MARNISKTKILIVLIAGIGDLILASKGIRAVRNGHPDAEIHLLTSKEVVPIAANDPHIDHVHPFPIRQFRKERKYLADMIRIVLDLRKIHFGMLVNLYRVCSFTGALKMGLLFLFLEAKVKVGHDRYGFGHFLTDKLPAGTFEGRHIVEAMQEIAARAGGVPDGRGIEVFWNTAITDKWEDFFKRLAGNIIVGINPGGDRSNRRWASDRFAAVARQLIVQFNARIILLGGPAERSIAASIDGGISSDVVNLSGQIPLDELPYVISRLDLLITNDSGPMHIAAATKTPLVAIFGPEAPRLFGPYTAPELYRVIHKDIPCRPCQNDQCKRPICLETISPEEVLAACIELLEGGQQYTIHTI